MYFLKEICIKTEGRTIIKWKNRRLAKREDSINTADSEKNPAYNDLYFSRQNGLAESQYIFIDGNSIGERIREKETFHIGETGFGTGLNLLSTLRTIEERGRFRLRYTSIEKYPLSPERIHSLLTPFSDDLSKEMIHYETCWAALYPCLKKGWNRVLWSFPQAEVEFSLYNGDALEWSREPCHPDTDAWYLDGHSPDKNPDIWSREVMTAVYKNTCTGGTLASFTASGLVKSSLREAGFYIKRKKGFGAKRHMIQGLKS